MRRQKRELELSIQSQGDFGQSCLIVAYENILSLITSLQQEKPSPRWIRANYSDKPEIRRSPSGDLYLQSGSYMIWLSDLDTLPKDGKDLNNPIQEQPEVELEKEAVKFVQSKEFIESKESPVLLTARHFAEWGAIHFNARKGK